MLGKKDMDDFDKSGDLNTIIGKGSIVEGTVKVQSSLRVDGRIKGQVSTTDSLVIGKEGEIEGEIRVKHAIVGGRITGGGSTLMSTVFFTVPPGPVTVAT